MIKRNHSFTGEPSQSWAHPHAPTPPRGAPALWPFLTRCFMTIKRLAALSGALRTFSWPIHCSRSEEHTSELQSRLHLVCRLLLEKKKKTDYHNLSSTKLASRLRPDVHIQQTHALHPHAHKRAPTILHIRNAYLVRHPPPQLYLHV